MHILICTDGTAVGAEAVRFGARLARPAAAEVTLLGIATAPDQAAAVQAALDQARSQFESVAAVIVRRGRVAREILAQADQADYDLIVVGSRGRRGWRRLAFGSVAARLARYSHAPVLIVKGAPERVERILACTGGGAPGERVARWSGQLAYWLGAEVAALHVMSQLPLSSGAPLADLTEPADDAIADGTREGRHLQRILDLIRQAGPGVPARPRLRHGLVLEEVIAEARGDDYDLICVGGHLAPAAFEQFGVLKDYLLEDVADQIIMASQRPVLVVKGE